MARGSQQTPKQGPASLPLRQLEIFHAVMTTRSVSAAARFLNVSQPSLSRGLQRLEDLLTLQLFKRSKRRLIPTTEALRIFEEVDGVIRQMQSLSSSIARIAQGHSSIFRFGATQSVSHFLVPRAIRMLTQRTPELQVFLDALLRVQHVDYLTSGQGECIVTLLEVRHPLLASRVIGTAPLVALVPRGHPLSRLAVLKPKDFAAVDIIGFEHSGPHSNAIESFLGGHVPRVRAFVRLSDAAVALAAEGVGIALVDDFTARGVSAAKLIRRPLTGAPAFTARLYWNSERPNSRHIDALGDALIEAVG
jgi:DNA-binding transcriptional LysR family regulator